MYYMPVKVFEEPGCVLTHRDALASLGERAMIVTGGNSSKKNGSLNDVITALETMGRTYVVFDEIEQNPSVDTVMKARDIAVEEGIDFFVGVGGGSPMDAAKAISLMAKHKEKDASFLFETGCDCHFPIAEVPTTCGTGSEVTPYSILTILDKETKSSIAHKIFPDLALLEPKYLSYAPLKVLQDTAMDALCHLYESYVNTNANDYSKMAVRRGLHVWKRSKAVLLGEHGPSMTDLSNMLRASAFAGMAIAQTGTSIPHGLSYALTYEMGVPHGQACGRFIAGYLRKAAPEDKDFMLALGGFKDLYDLQRFYENTCGTPDVPREVIDKAVAQVAGNPSKLANVPFEVDENVLKEIVKF